MNSSYWPKRQKKESVAVRVYQGLAKKKWSIFLAILQPHTQLHVHNTTQQSWQYGRVPVFATVKRIQSKTKKVKKLSSQANSPQGKSNVAITSQSPMHMRSSGCDGGREKTFCLFPHLIKGSHESRKSFLRSTLHRGPKARTTVLMVLL